MRGPAENRAIRFADGTSVPLSNPWKYQEVPDRLIAPQLPWGSVHGVTLDYNGMVLPDRSRSVFGARCGTRANRTFYFAHELQRGDAAGDDGGMAAPVRVIPTFRF